MPEVLAQDGMECVFNVLGVVVGHAHGKGREGKGREGKGREADWTVRNRAPQTLLEYSGNGSNVDGRAV